MNESMQNIENQESQEMIELKEQLQDIDPNMSVKADNNWYKLEYNDNQLAIPLEKDRIVPVAKLTKWTLDFYQKEHINTDHEFYIKLSELGWKYYDIHIENNNDWLLDFAKSILKWWSTNVIREELLKDKTGITNQELNKLSKWDYYGSKKGFMEQYATFLNKSVENLKNTKWTKDELNNLKATIKNN